MVRTQARGPRWRPCGRKDSQTDIVKAWDPSPAAVTPSGEHSSQARWGWSSRRAGSTSRGLSPETRGRPTWAEASPTRRQMDRCAMTLATTHIWTRAKTARPARTLLSTGPTTRPVTPAPPTPAGGTPVAVATRPPTVLMSTPATRPRINARPRAHLSSRATAAVATRGAAPREHSKGLAARPAIPVCRARATPGGPHASPTVSVAAWSPATA
jgi:hypothetical protein